MFFKRFFLAVFGAFFALTACTGVNVEHKYPEKVRGKYEMPSKKNEAERNDTLFGGDGLRLFSEQKNSETSLGVNVFLWRASLETLSFMPLASADPFGGVILTDWYEAAKGERFKMTVLITSKSLRADALKVSVFKQVADKNGNWSDAPANETMASDIQKAILTQARHLYLAHKQE